MHTSTHSFANLIRKQLNTSQLTQQAVPHARTSIIKAISLRLDLAAGAYNSSSSSTGITGGGSGGMSHADLNKRVAAGAACVEALARLSTEDTGSMLPLAQDLQVGDIT